MQIYINNNKNNSNTIFIKCYNQYIYVNKNFHSKELISY